MPVLQLLDHLFINKRGLLGLYSHSCVTIFYRTTKVGWVKCFNVCFLLMVQTIYNSSLNFWSIGNNVGIFIGDI